MWRGQVAHLRALLQVLLILVREHLIFSEGTFSSVDLSIQHMCIKCLLHCQTADICKWLSVLTRPKLKTPHKQASHHYHPCLSTPALLWSFFSSKARNANSMMDRPCPDATQKVVSGHFINPILNSHHALSLPKFNPLS